MAASGEPSWAGGGGGVTAVILRPRSRRPWGAAAEEVARLVKWAPNELRHAEARPLPPEEAVIRSSQSAARVTI